MKLIFNYYRTHPALRQWFSHAIIPAMSEFEGRHTQEDRFRECLEGHEGWGMAVWSDGYVEVFGPEGLTYNSIVEFDWYLIQDHATDDNGVVNEEDAERIRKDAVEGSTILDCVEIKKRFQDFDR